MSNSNRADEARKLTLEGQREIQKAEAEEQKKKQEQDLLIQEQMRQKANGLFEEAMNDIDRAARRGFYETWVSVMSLDKERRPLWAHYLSKFTKELIEQAGFLVTEETIEDKPVGSDPEVFYTRYSIRLVISWPEPI